MCVSCRTHRITITNFCLGKHLVSEEDLLKDQRGSPAYISPDVLSGEMLCMYVCESAREAITMTHPPCHHCNQNSLTQPPTPRDHDSSQNQEGFAKVDYLFCVPWNFCMPKKLQQMQQSLYGVLFSGIFRGQLLFRYGLLDWLSVCLLSSPHIKTKGTGRRSAECDNRTMKLCQNESSA